jgi:predicted nucleotidyltransferase
MTAQDWLTPLYERNLIPAGTVAAFLVGSAARGWHNARSDFDIYVVTTDEWRTETSSSILMPLDPPHVCSELFYESDRRWEVTYWLESQIDQMLAKVGWDVYDSNVIAVEVLSPREETSLARFGHCYPLLGEAWIEGKFDQLKRSAFRSIVTARSFGLADDAAEDALGQLESGNLESAVLSGHRALGHAVDGLLESEGEFGSHMPKWRPVRFKAAAPEILSFEEYWALETMRDYDPADPRDWVHRVLTVCQDISVKVEVS